ncbi:MAG TPA: hypothetical protein VHP38_02035, partial [Ruminiclostridium sp.]|nr:hypothetical protein [Ruminiclostridium sp.]
RRERSMAQFLPSRYKFSSADGVIAVQGYWRAGITPGAECQSKPHAQFRGASFTKTSVCPCWCRVLLANDARIRVQGCAAPLLWSRMLFAKTVTSLLTLPSVLVAGIFKFSYSSVLNSRLR